MNVKRFFAILLAAVCILPLAACSYLVKPEDGEIREAVEKLLPDAYTATYIIYGPGAELDPSEEINPDWKAAHYVPVADDYPYRTINDVKDLTLRAFSADYAEEMFEYAFEGNDVVMSRYNEYRGRLQREVVRHKELSIAKEFYPETLRVVSGNRYACKADIECLLANDARITVTLALVMENDRWKFDGPVY